MSEAMRVLSCAECGEELEVRCKNGHEPQPFKLRDAGASRADVPHRVSMPRTYKPKVCDCGLAFQPTGPRDIRCPACKGRVGQAASV
jgi:DNA-directed RNA polymerase subunit RPC12/RpoP